MKRALTLALPLLLSACSSASQYQKECADRYDQFTDVLTCTKEKLYSDPRAFSIANVNTKVNPADATEILNYGEELNSQVRQGLITDSQAKQLFAKKTSNVKERHEPAPLPIQPQGFH